jgi:hypothetical protein
MDAEIKCANCKHSYSFFKQTKDENGFPDFVTIPRCRLDNKITSDGTPECPDCFEPRSRL